MASARVWNILFCLKMHVRTPTCFPITVSVRLFREIWGRRTPSAINWRWGTANPCALWHFNPWLQRFAVSLAAAGQVLSSGCRWFSPDTSETGTRHRTGLSQVSRALGVVRTHAEEDRPRLRKYVLCTLTACCDAIKYIYTRRTLAEQPGFYRGVLSYFVDCQAPTGLKLSAAASKIPLHFAASIVAENVH